MEHITRIVAAAILTVTGSIFIPPAQHKVAVAAAQVCPLCDAADKLAKSHGHPGPYGPLTHR